MCGCTEPTTVVLGVEVVGEWINVWYEIFQTCCELLPGGWSCVATFSIGVWVYRRFGRGFAPTP